MEWIVLYAHTHWHTRCLRPAAYAHIRVNRQSERGRTEQMHANIHRLDVCCCLCRAEVKWMSVPGIRGCVAGSRTVTQTTNNLTDFDPLIPMDHFSLFEHTKEQKRMAVCEPALIGKCNTVIMMIFCATLWHPFVHHLTHAFAFDMFSIFNGNGAPVPTRNNWPKRIIK